MAHVPRVPESEEGDDIMIEDRVLNAEERATEYVARPYVEINDDVDDIRNAVQENMQTGCCRNNCYNSIDSNEIYMHILQMRELTSEEKDMYLIGKLKCKGIEGNGNEEKRKRYMYSFDDRDVCKSVFLFSHDIGEKSLKNLQKHMKTNGITPRVHGNVGKRPKHALEFETVKFAVQFILNFASQNGLPQPAAVNRKDSEPPIFLPASTTKKSVHNLYVESCEETSIRAMKLTSFQDVWISCCSHVQIPTPRTDVCYTCEVLKDGVYAAVSETDKLRASDCLSQHITQAQLEHEAYVSSVKRSREEISQYGNRPAGVLSPCSQDINSMHYTIDFAQQVSLPQHSRQVGPLYFATPRKIQVFGVSMEGCHAQYNYLVDESETIGVDGKEIHGPNAILSMMHHAMMTHGYGEMAATIHADNASGEYCMVSIFGPAAGNESYTVHVRDVMVHTIR